MKSKPITPAKKGNETMLYLGIALLAGGMAYAFSGGSKNPIEAQEPETNPVGSTNTNPTVVVPKPINYNLTLRIGSRGQEVEKLQTLLGVSSDGIFGPQTENALFNLKRVKSITLNGFAKIPNYAPLTKKIFPAGTKVMVSNRNGAKVYKGVKKADGIYYSSGNLIKTVAFGESVGTIRAASTDGQAHSVYFDSLLHKDIFLNDAVVFVNTIDIEKYT